MNACGIIRIFGVVVLLAAASVQCSKIHQRMSDDEIADLLRTIRDTMSESDMAPVMNNRHKRSDQNMPKDFTALGKKISDYLYPSEGQLFGADTPVWLAFTNSTDGTVTYKKMGKGIVGKVVSRLYGHSPPVLEEEKEDSKNRTTGLNSEASNANSTILEAHYNVTVNSTSMTGEEILRLASEIHEASISGNTTDASRVKRSHQEVIYPTLLVQTDFRGSAATLYDLDYYKEILYQLAFWTGVDLRFRQFNNPKIRLRLGGIIIGLDRFATPYLKSGDEAKIWNETREFWWKMGHHEDFPRTAYHIVVTMTDRRFFNNGSLLEGITTKSFCTMPSDRKFHTVAIVRDNGGTEGILKATRALGTLLGLDHDKDSGDECDNSKGFIMQSKFTPGPNNLKWSPCSLNHLSWFMRQRFMDCYDKPAEFHPPGRPLSIALPVSAANRHKQCQGRGYDWACEPSPDICGQLQCYHTLAKALTYGWWCQNTGPAAEGTRCAPGHICVDGVCQCITEECLFIY